MVTKSQIDYTPCKSVDAWFGYGKFGLRCGCSASPPPRAASPPPPSPAPPVKASPPPPPTKASPPPSPVPTSPSPPSPSPPSPRPPSPSPPSPRPPSPSPPVKASPPPPAGIDCVLYDSRGNQVSKISGPIIGGWGIQYGTATLTLDNAADTVTIALDLTIGWLVRGDEIGWEFYTSVADFEDSIDAPGSCCRQPPGLMKGQLSYTNRQDNNITVPLKDLTDGGCSLDTIYVVVHLPLVGRV